MLYDQRHAVSPLGHNVEGRLQAIAQKAVEQRMIDMHSLSPSSSLTNQECDILYQLENKVLAIHKEQIALMREKLACTTPSQVQNIVSFSSE